MHGLAVTSSFSLSAGLGWLLLPVLLGHCWRRYPHTAGLLLLVESGRVALPLESRFNLPLAGGTRAGTGWIELDLGPGSRLLILRDQLDRADWRRLGLFIGGGI